MSLRIRRGLSTDIPTPVEGELLYTTDEGKLYVGYNDPIEGEVIPKLTGARLTDDDTPTLSADLNLAGNNIVGTGNINIDGTINATGNINLGDEDSDTININGQINTSLIPTSTNLYDLGDITARWRNGYFQSLIANSYIESSDFVVGNSIVSSDSTVIYDNLSNSINIESITANIVEGNLIGNVYNENSSLIIDNEEGSFNTPSLKIIDEKIESKISEPLRVFSDKGLRNFGSSSQSITDSNAFVLNSIGDSDTSPLAIGDIVGAFAYSGYDGSDYIPTNVILSEVDSDASGSILPGKLVVYSADVTGSLNPTMTIDSAGTISGGIFKTGTYNNTTERDNQIPNPEAGMIIFLNDVSPKFQGYDGTQWVDFN